MKPTNFAYFLSKYLSGYLAGQQNFSSNTVASYRDTFKLILRFFSEEKGLPAERLTLEMLDRNTITDYLEWLRTSRQNSETTLQQRLTVIRSFFSYLQGEAPEYLLLSQSVMSYELKKPPASTIIKYLSFEEVKNILAQPNCDTRKGRRDLALLTLLYDSGARVQELVDIRARDIRLTNPAGVNLFGKGSKWRYVPLMKVTVDLLKEYVSENKLFEAHRLDNPLFPNHSGNKMTRAGVAYTIQKYACSTREKTPHHILPSVTPHTFRHSKAMHLLQSGVPLIYIRDILGHTDITTTEIYARADSESKRKALENAYHSPIPETRPLWTEDEAIMKMLQELV